MPTLPQAESQMKKCSICHADKPESEFYKLSRGYALYPYCRDCAKINAKEKRDKKKENTLNTSLYLPI